MTVFAATTGIARRTGENDEDATVGGPEAADTVVIDPPDAPSRRRRRAWPWVVGGVLGVIGGPPLWPASSPRRWPFRPWRFRDDLLASKATLGRLGSLVEAKDEAGLQAAADDVSARTSRAAATVQGPLWQAAADIPVVGANIDAVSRVTRAVDILVREALPPASR